jgi:hypothetical protein
MAKSSTAEVACASAVSPSKKRGFDDWEVREAMRTMMRAGEIVKDKKLLEAVRKEAQKHAAELEATAKQAGQLAKMGRISPKQMAKLGSR